MAYGLTATTLEAITAICAQRKQVEEVILFGSRAMGSHKENSDIDLAIRAPHLKYQEYLKLWRQLKDLPILNKIDLVILDQTIDSALHDHIQRRGITLWSQKSFNQEKAE